jgi:uncharacterized protein YraI
MAVIDAVVVGNGINVRTGPGTKYPSIAKVDEGLRIKLLEKVGNWYRMESRDGKIKGWIHQHYVFYETHEP